MTRPRAAQRTGGIAAGLVGLLVAGMALVGVGVEPAVASEGACPDDRGVTVVVDFRDLGGATLVRCAEQPVDTGFDALRRAMVEFDVVASSPGFLCRIEGRPAADPCQQIPPPDAYWSYWTGERGGGWTYNEIGAASRTPPPGSVEGWSFSTGSDSRGSAPRTPPPAAATSSPSPTPSPTPSPSASPSPTPNPTPSPSASASPSPTPAAPETSPTEASPSAAPPTPTTARPVAPAAPAAPAPRATTPDATTAPTTPSTSPTVTSSPTPEDSESPVDSATSDDLALVAGDGDDDGGGPALGPILGLLLVVGVGAGAAVAARRRR